MQERTKTEARDREERDTLTEVLRAEQHRLCALVVIGVNSQGEKPLLAIEDGVRASTQSWRNGW